MTESSLTPVREHNTLRAATSFLLRNSHIVALIVLLAVASLASPYFLGTRNIMNVLRGAAPMLIVSAGMTIVIISRGIDLSVGSILGFSAMLIGVLMPYGAGIAIVAALIGGTILGLINGLLITKLRLQPFIATLAMLIAARGFVYIATDGANIVMRDSPAWFKAIGSGYLWTVPIPVLIAFFVWLYAAYLLSWSRLGRHIYAIGANEEAARLYGIPCDLVKIKVYALAALFSAIAGIIMASRLNVAEPNVGQLMELDAISATLIGGTSLDGGIGGVLGTVFGVLILAVLSNILNLLNISPFVQMVLQGVIIVIAVVMSEMRYRAKS
ncbi:ABC transporter permease [Castellaniella sp. S9]|uniref:ABC transporter permease n=1 Tax=Castellaniella sp. S9 TaxID=2993652 RepID=UPI0022B3B4BD|nr:ABC transporter permease [Castellaniella sp. S9]